MNAHRPHSPPFGAGLGRIRSRFPSSRIEDSPQPAAGSFKVAVVVFPGSNCDRDCQDVARDVVGASVQPVWHRDAVLPAVDLVILPGGFSYGDYLRTGAPAGGSPRLGA